MPKAKYNVRICYDDDFKPHIEKFLRLIMLDKEIDKVVKKNKNQRFSVVIRFLIKRYNELREPKIMEQLRIKNENSM